MPIYDLSATADRRVTLENFYKTVSGLTTVTAAVGDVIPVNDASDSNNPKKVTVQTIVDLVTVPSGDPAISAQTGGNFTAGSSTSNTLYVVSTADAVCTLPAASGVADGFRIRVKNSTNGLSVTIARAGSDTIDGETSIRVPGRSEIEVTKTAAATWEITKDAAHYVGEVIEWYTDSLPRGGWVWANGVAISRTTYAGLFAVWSTAFGTGDGSTTFNPPDKRGRVAAGKDDMGGASAASRLTSGGSEVDGAMLGASGGAQTHTLVTGEMPAHTHTGAANAGSPASLGAEAQTLLNGTTNTGSTGGGGAHNNTQPTIIANFIVKT
jgi:microcystin-dependent protein